MEDRNNKLYDALFDDSYDEILRVITDAIGNPAVVDARFFVDSLLDRIMDHYSEIA